MSVARSQPVKRTFNVNNKYKDACAAKGYIAVQEPSISTEITGNVHTGYKLICEWEGDPKATESVVETVQSMIEWILSQ